MLNNVKNILALTIVIGGVIFFSYTTPIKIIEKCQNKEIRFVFKKGINESYKPSITELIISDKEELLQICNMIKELKLDIFAPNKFKEYQINIYINPIDRDKYRVDMFYVYNQYVFRINNNYQSRPK